MIEMIARVVVKALREMWRQERHFSILPLLRLTVDFLNKLRNCVTCETGNSEWIRERILRKFGPNVLDSDNGNLQKQAKCFLLLLLFKC
jgi:hypothetical protein